MNEIRRGNQEWKKKRTHMQNWTNDTERWQTKQKTHRGLKRWATQTPSKNIDVPIFSRTVISSFSYKVPVRFDKFLDCDGFTENIYLQNLPTFTQTCVFWRVITHFFLAGQDLANTHLHAKRRNSFWWWSIKPYTCTVVDNAWLIIPVTHQSGVNQFT